MNPYVLKPSSFPIIVEGKLSYNDNSRSNNILRFRKEIMQEFRELKGEKRIIRYRQEYHRTPEELMRRIREIIDNKEGLPFLLWFISGNGNEYRE